MTAVVGSYTPYSAYQEYGFHGTEDVRSFMRRSKAQMASAKYNKLGLETRPSKAKAKGTGDILVHAFTREVNYEGRSYLRTSLAENQMKIAATILEAAQAGMKE